jgi:hypothetical protein
MCWSGQLVELSVSIILIQWFLDLRTQDVHALLMQRVIGYLGKHTCCCSSATSLQRAYLNKRQYRLDDLSFLSQLPCKKAGHQGASLNVWIHKGGIGLVHVRAVAAEAAAAGVVHLKRAIVINHARQGIKLQGWLQNKRAIHNQPHVM